MKKIMMFLLAGIMALNLVACGGGVSAEVANAEELLTNVWEEYQASASEDIQFPIGGGNAQAAVMDAPGEFDLALPSAQDELLFNYCYPTENLEFIDDAATAMNMMMANNFTTAAYHVVDATNMQTIIDELKETTENNQWMCGLPETFIIVTVGENYVVSAFGNGQVIEAYKAAIISVYGDAAEIVVEESLAE